MSLLKPIQKTLLLIPYEQSFIETFYQNGKLIQEQHSGDQNPLLQLAIDHTLRNNPPQPDQYTARNGSTSQYLAPSGTSSRDNLHQPWVTR
jgi:hypothetical protein